MRNIEELASIAVDCGLRLHRDLGPGLLESVYEAILAIQLSRVGLAVERQKLLPVKFDGVAIPDGFRVDLLVDGQLIIEVKSVERLAPVHSKQLLTYLRLADQPVGLLMNFGGDTFREGLKRVVNGAGNFSPRGVGNRAMRIVLDVRRFFTRRREEDREGAKKVFQAALPPICSKSIQLIGAGGTNVTPSRLHSFFAPSRGSNHVR